MPDYSAEVEATVDVPQRQTEVRTRLRLRRRKPLNKPTSRVSRRLAANYLRLYNKHVHDSQSLEYFLPAGHRRTNLKLEDSIVSGIHWTSDEKEQLFHSLARRGKRNVEMLVQDLSGRKSVLEISGYLHALETELHRCYEFASRRKFPTVTAAGLLTYDQLPIAHEVSPTLMARESVFAKYVAQQTGVQENRLEARIGWSRIDATTAVQIQTDLSLMTERRIDIMSRAAPDLVTLDVSRICKGPSEVYKSTMEHAYSIMVQKTRQVVRRAIQAAELRAKSERGSYFAPERFRSGVVGVPDVMYATEQVMPDVFEDVILNHETGTLDDNDGDNHDDGDRDGEGEGDGEESDDGKDDLMSECSQEVDDQDAEIEAILDRHDTFLDSLHDTEHRRYLGLLPSINPQSHGITRAERTKLIRHDWCQRQVEYHHDDAGEDDEMEV